MSVKTTYDEIIKKIFPLYGLIKTLPSLLKKHAKDSAINNLDNFCRKCTAGSVCFLFSKPQHSWLCEDFENAKWAEDAVQLRIRKSKLFLAES